MAKSKPITDYKTVNGLRTNVYQNRRLANSELKPVYALDTETDKRGNIRIIADSDGRFLSKISIGSLIRWLFHKKYQGSWNFFYNLTFDSEVFLKNLPKEMLEKYKETGQLNFEYEEYKIEFIPSKTLAIRKGKHSTVFFDIAQYYHESLVNAYQNNIGILPKEYLEMKKKRKVFSDYFFKRNKTEIIKYCIQDCKYTKELTEHWIKIFHKAFGFYPSRWISSGYLAEKVLINQGIHIPRFLEIPYDVQEIASNAYFGGRFEILKRGYIGQAFLYDINSAYPDAITKVPELTKGTWVKSIRVEPKALLGFFKIEADVPYDKFVPPFPFRKDIMIIFPSGKFVTYCTLEELRAVEDESYYTILDSWQYIDDNPHYPYKEFIQNLYLKRQELKKKKDPLQLPIKIILNSIYGKTGQTIKGRIGNLFNPVIFSFITGYTRAKLYRFVKEHGLESEVVSFATDSICTTKRVHADSADLGDFTLKESGNDVFYLQNGYYRFNGQFKQRGLGKLSKKEIENSDIVEKDGKIILKCKVVRVKRLRSSIIQGCIDDVGKFAEFEREIDLNADKKRFWASRLKSLDEKIVNVSAPLPLDVILKSNL